MSRVARFRVYGRFDVASGAQEATVEVDRGTNVIRVRPKRRRRTYDLDLATVASIICEKVIRYELAEKKRLRREKRGRR